MFSRGTSFQFAKPGEALHHSMGLSTGTGVHGLPRGSGVLRGPLLSQSSGQIKKLEMSWAESRSVGDEGGAVWDPRASPSSGPSVGPDSLPSPTLPLVTGIAPQSGPTCAQRVSVRQAGVISAL